MFSREKIILVVVILFGFLIRIVNISNAPPSLNWDEVSHGWNAYSILKTGVDEWGQRLPLANFRAYGDYPLPLNLYITIPSIAVFGLNEFGIRFPHVILGSLTIMAAFFLVKGLKFGRIAALFAALFVAIDPWTLFPSRAVFQSNISLFLITAGFAFFFNRHKKSCFLPLSILCWGLSAYSYHNARIIIPPILIFVIVIWKSEWKSWWMERKKAAISALVILLVFIIPILPIIANPESRARSKWVFLVDQGAINRIVEQRQNSQLPDPLSKVVFNKYTYFTTGLASNLFGYFSPKFLFLEGGTDYQFSIPGKGLLYPINTIFFYFGLVLVGYRAFLRKKEYITLAAWTILGLIPAAITTGEFHVIRSTTILPLPEIFTALGLVTVAGWLSNKPKIKLLFYFKYTVYLGLLIFFVFNYLSLYFGTYRTNYSWSWQFGYKEAVNFAKENYNKYDEIIVTKKYGEPHEFFLFYWPWDPKSFRQDKNLIRFYQSDWYWVDRFDKFYFVNDWDVPKVDGARWKLESGSEILQRGRLLLITSPGNYPNGWTLIKTINFLDGRPAFDILEKNV